MLILLGLLFIRLKICRIKITFLHQGDKMAQTPIEYSPVPATYIVSSGSRYERSKVIYYGEQRFMTFETYVRRNYDTSGNESVMVITKGVEYRPDLVSHDYYGYPDHWWRILEANGMKDVFEFKTGTTIVLPKAE
jgi:hypothetical protein